MCSRWCHKNIQKRLEWNQRNWIVNVLTYFFPSKFFNFSSPSFFSHQLQTSTIRDTTSFCFLLLWPSTAQEISFSFRKFNECLPCRRQKLSSSTRSKDQLRKIFISRRRCSLIYFVFNFYCEENFGIVSSLLAVRCDSLNSIRPTSERCKKLKTQTRETRGELSLSIVFALHKNLCLIFLSKNNSNVLLSFVFAVVDLSSS